MQNNPLFAKKIYVPSSAQKAVVKKGPARADLPHELALQPAQRVFRSVAWDGAAVVAFNLPAPAEPLDLTAPARVAFAQVAWTGEARVAPTAIQSARSVVNVLGQFKWE